jgi:hypothetical protein
VSYLLLPYVWRVASLAWVLDRRHLRHLRRCGVAAGCAAMRARRAETALACAALRHAVVGRTGRGRPGKHRPSAVHVGRADVASVGQAPLCNWAECGFGLVTLELVFLISEYIQILANLKICVGFI